MGQISVNPIFRRYMEKFLLRIWKTIKVKGRLLAWIHGDLINLFKDRDRAQSKYSSTRDSTDWDIYKKLRNICTKTQIAKAICFKDWLAADFNHPKAFWGRRNNLSNLSCNQHIKFIGIKNEIVNEFFEITDECSFTPFFWSQLNLNISIIIFYLWKLLILWLISSIEVHQVLDSLRSDSSAAPDGLEIRVL